MNSETIDVTDYIESGEYRTDSCKNQLNRLIKTKPLLLDKTYENQLKEKIEKWVNINNNILTICLQDTFQLEISDIIKTTKYQYSYFITDKPIDVYKTEFEDKDKSTKFSLFIRLDNNGHIFSDYNENGWVTNICDSNSIPPKNQ